MVLAHYDRHWQAVEFDPSTGAGRVRWLRRRPARIGGFTKKVGARWVAVRKSGGELVFQAGERVWPLSSATNFTVEPSPRGKRTFRVRRGSEVEFEIIYKDPALTYLARNDPARDALDEEHDDIFLYIAMLSEDERQQANLASIWVE